MVRKVLSCLFFIGALIFLGVFLSNMIGISNTEFSGDPIYMFYDILSNLFYVCFMIVSLVVSSTLYIVDAIKTGKK